jgi:hypothetical protein
MRSGWRAVAPRSRAFALLLALPVPVGLGLPPAAPPTVPPAAVVPPHELHETYADLAIEGGVVAGRIRFFKRDLERALGPILESDEVSLAPGAEADALVVRYLRDRLVLVAAGDTLAPRLLAAEEVRLGHHAGWQVTLSWSADRAVGALRVRSTLLFELHDDQRNIMRFVRWPDETRETLTLEAGAPEGVVAGRGG